MAEQHNVRVIYVVGNTPQWTSTDPNRIGFQGLPGATAPPRNIQDWQDYVRTVVTRYKGRIAAYEVWNEVDLDGYWTGSVSQMVQIVQTAYTAIKQVDSDAIVLVPSLVQNKGRDYLQNLFKAGGNQYSDAVPYHPYDVSATPEPIVSSVYRSAVDVAHQWGKEIWDTEMGWGPWATPSSEAEGAAYTTRAMILQAASGINVIVWFAWDDRDWVHLPFVRSDFQTPTPAAVAFQQVQSWLMSASITCTNTPDGTWQCPVTARGVQKYIVWNTDATTTFRIPASWQVKTANDLAGNSQAISDGSVTIGHLPIMLSP